MTRYVSIWATLLIAVIVHIDWHFGRGHHHRLSLNWPYHWVIGLVAFFLLALFCARKWPEHAARATLLNAALGLFAGQILEPLVEVVGYRMPIAAVFTNERWTIFGQFAAAAAAGLLLGIAAVWLRRSRGRPQTA